MRAMLENEGVVMLPSQDVFRLTELDAGNWILSEDLTHHSDSSPHINTYGKGKSWSREEAIDKAVAYYFEQDPDFPHRAAGPWRDRQDAGRGLGRARPGRALLLSHRLRLLAGRRERPEQGQQERR
jgi:hypothetical protein